jgi:hypothetical protein
MKSVYWLLVLLLVRSVSPVGGRRTHNEHKRYLRDHNDHESDHNHRRSRGDLDYQNNEGMSSADDILNDVDVSANSRSSSHQSNNARRSRRYSPGHLDKSDDGESYRPSPKKHNKAKRNSEDKSEEDPQNYHRYQSYDRTFPFKFKGGHGWISQSRTH